MICLSVRGGGVNPARRRQPARGGARTVCGESLDRFAPEIRSETIIAGLGVTSLMPSAVPYHDMIAAEYAGELCGLLARRREAVIVDSGKCVHGANLQLGVKERRPRRQGGDRNVNRR